MFVFAAPSAASEGGSSLPGAKELTYEYMYTELESLVEAVEAL